MACEAGAGPVPGCSARVPKENATAAEAARGTRPSSSAAQTLPRPPPAKSLFPWFLFAPSSTKAGVKVEPSDVKLESAASRVEREQETSQTKVKTEPLFTESQVTELLGTESLKPLAEAPAPSLMSRLLALVPCFRGPAEPSQAPAKEEPTSLREPKSEPLREGGMPLGLEPTRPADVVVQMSSPMSKGDQMDLLGQEVVPSEADLSQSIAYAAELSHSARHNEAFLLDKSIDLVSMPDPPQPPQPAPLTRPLTEGQILAKVLELFPWGQPDWLRSQLRRGRTLEELVEQMAHPSSTAPRAAKRRRDADEARRPEADYLSRPLVSRRTEKEYMRAAQGALADRFPWLATFSLRRVLAAFGENFAPAYRALLAEVRSQAFREQLAVKTLRGLAVQTQAPLGAVWSPSHHWLPKSPPLTQLHLLTAKRRPKHRALPPSLASELAWVELNLGLPPHFQPVPSSSSSTEDERMECEICCESLPPVAFKSCRDGHPYCHGCLERHAADSVASGEVRCPEAGCRAGFSKALLDQLLPAAQLRRLEERAAAVSVAAAGLEDFVSCRHCPWGAVLDAVPQAPVFRCGGCEAAFCRRCGRDWGRGGAGTAGHEGRRCEELAAAEELEEGAKRRRLEEAQSLVRRCGRCRLAFVREGGCKRMSCACGATSCDVCRAEGVGCEERFCACPTEPRQPCRQCAKCPLWDRL